MIYVAAAGAGSRIRSAMVEAGFPDMPKHMLPTGEPGSTSLLRRNTIAAHMTSEGVTVIVNDENAAVIQAEVGDLGCDFKTVQANDSLGPFSFTTFLDEEETGMSVAADTFIDPIRWQGFVSEHIASKSPVSFLVGKTSVGREAAVFDVDSDDTITNFHRTRSPESNVLRNIGLYAFTMTPPVVEVMHSYRGCSVGMQDAIVTDLVAQRLVRAQLHTGVFFNINTLDDYLEMVNFNKNSPTPH